MPATGTCWWRIKSKIFQKCQYLATESWNRMSIEQAPLNQNILLKKLLLSFQIYGSSFIGWPLDQWLLDWLHIREYKSPPYLSSKGKIIGCMQIDNSEVQWKRVTTDYFRCPSENYSLCNAIWEIFGVFREPEWKRTSAEIFLWRNAVWRRSVQ